MANQQNERGQTATQNSDTKTSGGGRGERQVEERQQELADSGSQGGQKIPRSTKTVKSEPHWDPTESPKGEEPSKAPE